MASSAIKMKPPVHDFVGSPLASTPSESWPSGADAGRTERPFWGLSSVVHSRTGPRLPQRAGRRTRLCPAFEPRPALSPTADQLWASPRPPAPRASVARTPRWPASSLLSLGPPRSLLLLHPLPSARHGLLSLESHFWSCLCRGPLTAGWVSLDPDT